MENASNALLIAGGVLIGVLILSLAVYLFADFGAKSADINQRTAEQQLTQFNSKFTVYESKENKWTIYDIITVAGYAHENNKYYTDEDSSGKVDTTFFKNNYKIQVDIKESGITIGTTDVQEFSTNKYHDMIQDEPINETGLPKYKCEIYYHDNGRVSKIVFKK